VRVVRSARLPAAPAPVPAAPPAALPEPIAPDDTASVVLIGCSTGGPAALLQLARQWRGCALPPIVVAQHLPAEFTAELARQMAAHLGAPVREAVPGDRPRPGLVLIVPGGCNMELDASGAARLSQAGPSDRWVPSVDRLFESAAMALGARAHAVVSTGMGNDGTAGAAAVRRAGGTVWAQDEETSIIDGMPRSVREAGYASRVLPLTEIGRALAAPPPPHSMIATEKHLAGSLWLRVGGRDFSLALERVRRVALCRQLRCAPPRSGVPSWWNGVTLDAGQPHPLLNLAELIGVPAAPTLAPDSVVVLSSLWQQPVGLVCDHFRGVIPRRRRAGPSPRTSSSPPTAPCRASVSVPVNRLPIWRPNNSSPQRDTPNSTRL
jgi:chemotaxis signal transduction protein